MDNNQISPIKIRKMVANADRKEAVLEIIFVVIVASFGTFLLLWLIHFIFQLDIWIPNIRNNCRNSIFKNYRWNSKKVPKEATITTKIISRTASLRSALATILRI